MATPDADEVEATTVLSVKARRRRRSPRTPMTMPASKPRSNVLSMDEGST